MVNLTCLPKCVPVAEQRLFEGIIEKTRLAKSWEKFDKGDNFVTARTRKRQSDFLGTFFKRIFSENSGKGRF